MSPISDGVDDGRIPVTVRVLTKSLADADAPNADADAPNADADARSLTL
jgi:hypothetical protein